jgi:hypothetical protein
MNFIKIDSMTLLDPFLKHALDLKTPEEKEREEQKKRGKIRARKYIARDKNVKR